MKSNYLGVFVFLFFCTTSFATDVFKYTLEKHHDFKSNTSFEINDNSTVHLLVLKNNKSKKYDLIPFYVNASNETKQFDTVSFVNAPELISYHVNGDILTVLGHYQRTLEIIDYSLSQGTVTKTFLDNYKRPKNIFKAVDKTVIVAASKKAETLSIKTIHNSGNTEDLSLTIPQNLQRSINYIFKTKFEVVDTNDYLKDGSIAHIQAYMEHGNFFFASFDKLKNHFSLISVHPKETVPFKKSNLKSTGIEKLRDGNMQLKEGNVFALFLAKDDFAVNIYNATSGEEIKSFSLKNDLANFKRIKYIKFDFMKESIKGKYKPTLAVNENQDNQYIVTISYVDKNTYAYNYWWFHHQFMMQQQHMMMMQQNMPSKPGAAFDPYQDFNGYFFMEKPLPLKIVLDKNLNLIEDGILVTKKRYVDKEKYIQKLNEKSEINSLSVSFLDNTYYYMYTNSSERNIYIKSGAVDTEIDYFRN